MKVIFKKSQGPWLEAEIVVKDQLLVVMDELSLGDLSDPKDGEMVDVELCAMCDEDESWESIFSGNPHKVIKLERIDSWKYRAYGKVVSVNPVIVDCGIVVIDEVVDSSDPNLVGEYVAFEVSRLSVSHKM